MKTIYQKTERDCGVAVLAMLSGVSYRKAFDFLDDEFGRTFTLSSGKIIAGLLHFGRTPVATRCQSVRELDLAELEHDALLGGDCLVPNGSNRWKRSGHWAVWDVEDQCIRDPYGYAFPFHVRKLLLVE